MSSIRINPILRPRKISQLAKFHSILLFATGFICNKVSSFGISNKFRTNNAKVIALFHKTFYCVQSVSAHTAIIRYKIWRSMLTSYIYTAEGWRKKVGEEVCVETESSVSHRLIYVLLPLPPPPFSNLPQCIYVFDVSILFHVLYPMMAL
jgi:hypothetical protein